jgi:hypothetical protein
MERNGSASPKSQAPFPDPTPAEYARQAADPWKSIKDTRKNRVQASRLCRSETGAGCQK